MKHLISKEKENYKNTRIVTKTLNKVGTTMKLWWWNYEHVLQNCEHCLQMLEDICLNLCGGTMRTLYQTMNDVGGVKNIIYKTLKKAS